LQSAAAYASADAAAVLQLIPRCASWKPARLRLLEEMEMPLVTVLADMEMAGIALDTAF
jgi:DNA polymerase I-like protein with 3'-5' exonuclease and polymerase domains